jgi:hypothetical protein|tara:strand:+ start:4388 stop:6823 length:2436 start_codon:yes stop_codon:yes gene_type:complete
MQDDLNQRDNFGNFPNPMADAPTKMSKAYGLKYAMSIEKQWGSADNEGSTFRRRMKAIELNRDYAHGTQDTNIYKKILTSLDPSNGDGSLLNLDWTPVPIVPKFVKIVVNKILSKDPYPKVEAIDPVSRMEKEKERDKIKRRIKNRDIHKKAKDLGLKADFNIDALPETEDEAEIFLNANLKIASESVAQIATDLTLQWNDFNEKIYRRAVEDLVVNGIAVVKRENDPNYGIVEEYVDPAYFVHSYTEDPNFTDLVYAGHMKRMTIQDLKRKSENDFTEEEFEQIANQVRNKYNNNASKVTQSHYDRSTNKTSFGYDEYIVEVLDFEFLSVDDIIYEEKTSRFGNTGFHYKGYEYKAPTQSVYDRNPVSMKNTTVYGGTYVIGTKFIFGYGMKKNLPKNVHDISRARMSYSAIATNMRRMMPKSMVNGVIGFADQLQLTHLKIQQAIAKAKPDGLLVDIEGLENVQLGRGGDLQPLDIQDIYEQTGVFYYRSKNPEGGFQNPPVRALENSIRNINEMIGIYNHYLRMIRDATGINEVMDGTSAKGEQLVGVREQQMAAGNNAIYDITNAAAVLYRKVCEDVVKCLQVIPPGSVLYNIYTKALGEQSMSLLNSFRDLPMYNFGIRVVNEMGDNEKAYLEQNIQIALGQKEIDLEDAISIRQLKDVDQAEQLLIVRRQKRRRDMQKLAQQNSQMQAQANSQVAQATSQGKMQEAQMMAQLDLQKLQMETQAKAQLLEMEYQLKMQLEQVKQQASGMSREMESSSKRDLDIQKEDRKDERVKKQAVEQSKLISQRQGTRGELEESEELDPFDAL